MAMSILIAWEMMLITSREEFNSVLIFVYGMINLVSLWIFTKKGLQPQYEDRYGILLLGIYLVAIGGIIFITIH